MKYKRPDVSLVKPDYFTHRNICFGELFRNLALNTNGEVSLAIASVASRTLNTKH